MKQRTTRRYTQARKAQLIDWLRRYFKASDAAYQQAFHELAFDKVEGMTLELSFGPMYYTVDETKYPFKNCTLNKQLKKERNNVFKKDYLKLLRELKELNFQDREISGIINSLCKKNLWWETLFDTSKRVRELGRGSIAIKMVFDFGDFQPRGGKRTIMQLLNRIVRPNMEE